MHNLAISVLLTCLLCALQGDDEARGGQALDAEVDCARSSEGDDDASDGDDVGFADDIDEAFGSQVQIQSVSPGRGFETAKGSSHDIGQQWSKVKE